MLRPLRRAIRAAAARTPGAGSSGGDLRVGVIGLGYVVLPLAVVYGAAVLIVCDLIARTVVSPGELPIGVVTAFLGAPFFLLVLRTMRGPS